MSNQIDALIIVLEEDMPEDNAEAIMTTIRQIRGVLDVQPHAADSVTNFIAYTRLKNSMLDRLMQIVKERP